ncbi:hypothetical protein, partial [Escherichia coli]|uniref:hypothetical protein n=1 Tax=Escherichia coli TaxID=562 RepID=UPI001BC88591
MSFKLLQHRPQVGAFLEQQLLVQLENVLQVAAEYAPHELVTYGLPGHSHLNRPGFPGEYFICELRLPDHYFRWK